MAEVLDATIRDGVMALTMRRPHARNAIDAEMRNALLEAFDNVVSSGARAVLLSGEGPAFCAGADISSDLPTGVGTVRRMRVSTHRLIEQIIECPVPVVAAVHGACAGYGMAIALASDFCVVANDAKFVPAFGAMGLTPDGAIAATVTRSVGLVQARRILLLGERFSGESAVAMGLVHAGYDASVVLEEGLSLARRLARGPTMAYGFTKGMILRGPQMDIPALLREERLSQGLLSFTEDHQEAVSAFREHRPAEFEGR